MRPSGFGSISGGATPDCTIPSNFFSAAGDSLIFAPTFGPNGADKKTFASAPTDGVDSLNFTGAFSGSATAANSPRNYAGNGASVNLSTPSPTGDYNGDHLVNAADYVIWRSTLGQSVTAGHGADGNGNGTIDAGDYDFWRSKFGNAAGNGSGLGSAISTPEPAAVCLVLTGVIFTRLRRLRIS